MSQEALKLSPIPHPFRFPVLGNLPQLAAAPDPLTALVELTRAHGPIFELEMKGRRGMVVSDPALVEELSDDKRFYKFVPLVLRALRVVAENGLFTADSDDPEWARAHRVLLPAFRRDAMQRYVPTMISAIGELAEAWGRGGPEALIDVSQDMTRLTLDIIARTGFGYRFGPLDQQDAHPFVVAIGEALRLGMSRGLRPELVQSLMIGENRRLRAAAKLLHDHVDSIIAARRADPSLLESENDLLSLMLTAGDPETGERLSDASARNQVITFLIAGHETTAGALSFAIQHLLAHPEALARLRAEADEVLGDGSAPDFRHALRLRYTQQVVQEVLRLHPTVPVFGRAAREDTVIGGRYPLSKDGSAMVLLLALHRDPKIWGEDAEQFEPDHFSPERAAQRPKGAYLPFGVGARACLGRQFAMTEATLALATLLRRFDLVEDASSRPEITYAATIRLQGLRVRAVARG